MLIKTFIRLLTLFAILGGGFYALYFYETSENFDPFDGKYTFHRNMEYEKWDTIIHASKSPVSFQKFENQIMHSYLVECGKVMTKGFNFDIDSIIITEEEFKRVKDETIPEYFSEKVLNNPKRKQRIYNVLAFYQLDTVFISENYELKGRFNYKGRKIEIQLECIVLPYYQNDSIRKIYLGLGYDTDYKQKSGFEKFMDSLFGTCR